MGKSLSMPNRILSKASNSGIYYRGKVNYQKTIEMLYAVIDNSQYAYLGHLSLAQFNLGSMYYFAIGVEVNYQMARKMFQAIIDNPRYAPNQVLSLAQERINSIDKACENK